jgi:DNA-binding transcriptional regulator GbsR (MarR family)
VSFSIRPEDAPAEWRPTIRVLGYAVSMLIAGVVLTAGFYAVVRTEARAETQRVIATDLETFKGAALQAAEHAAREGAQQAVRDAVAPLAGEMQAAQERDRSLEGRIERLEDRNHR